MCATIPQLLNTITEHADFGLIRRVKMTGMFRGGKGDLQEHESMIEARKGSGNTVEAVAEADDPTQAGVRLFQDCVSG